ncbi:MAG: 5-formyltetrahydrofolate cyclo-ligase [Cyanobacteriota bacterium]
MEAAGKPELRRHFRLVRKQLLSDIQPVLAAAAQDALPALMSPGKRLGLYWPVSSEPDLRQLAALVLCALPLVEDGQLTYRPWRPGEELGPDQCGIPAPQGSPPCRPGDLDLLLVPALALDRQGIRLGSGGGWYDRLRAAPAWRAIPALAVLPSACLRPALPRDSWDVPFDGWLDERGLHWL